MFNLKPNHLFITVVISAIVGLIFFTGYQKGKAHVPAVVDTHIVEQLNQQVVDLTQSLHEAEMNLQTMKSEKTNKTKHLITHADGSSDLVESENSETVETELLQAKSKVVEQTSIIESLQHLVVSDQKIKDELLNIQARAVYDSDRGLEYEGSAGYKIYSAGAGLNYDKKAWRVGAGLNFSF